MNTINILPVLLISLGFISVDLVYSKVEFLRKNDDQSRHELLERNGMPINKANMSYLKPVFNNSQDLVPSNRTQEFLELYKEMSAILDSRNTPIRRAYIDGVLVPRTDAKVAKLQAETAYIETKNAAKRKQMNLLKEDFEKNTPFSSMVSKLLNSTPNVNSTQILNSIYNETFYYINNKNMTNSTQDTVLEFS
ncbi:putative secreted protein [Cryptosporidium canis]|uniref:Secreted protein n=1 Tax=Cryptosporidium canis TaxID=195482 RepID=A0A9D5DIJ4_9CRYT|nr:putative secreted protein [Cryptosporidium canis]